MLMPVWMRGAPSGHRSNRSCGGLFGEPIQQQLPVEPHGGSFPFSKPEHPGQLPGIGFLIDRVGMKLEQFGDLIDGKEFVRLGLRFGSFHVY